MLDNLADTYVSAILDAKTQGDLTECCRAAVMGLGPLVCASAKNLYRISSAAEARAQELTDAHAPLVYA